MGVAAVPDASAASEAASSSEPRLLYQARGLVRSYVMGGKVLRVVDGVSLEIHKGEVLAITGRSGAGKSTLLQLLGLLDRPHGGELIYEDRDITRLNRGAQARLRGSAFGFIFQFYHLLPEFTALQNVLMPAMVKHSWLSWRGARGECTDYASGLLERVGLGERTDHRPSQLSGGERQRVAVARALMNKPAVVFCDEPTGNLDRQTAETVEALILELARTLDQAFVIVTHDESFASRADRALAMQDGKLVSSSAS